MKSFFDRAIRRFSIGQFLLILSGIVMVFALTMVMVLSQFVERKAIQDLAQEEARQTSELIFQSLFSAMRMGWNQNDLLEIVDRLNQSRPDANIRVFRSPSVQGQFGPMTGPRASLTLDALAQDVMSSGEERLVYENDELRYLYPVIVREECQMCHQSPIGTVNGIVDISYPITNLKVSLGFVINSVLLYFILILSLIFIALYYKLRIFIAVPIASFVKVMDEIVTHTDLSRRVENSSGQLREVQKLTSHFNRLLTTIQDYQDRLKTYSERDPLTGLYNRRKFEEYMKLEVDRAARHNREFTLIMLDVDNFKHINDTFGHPVGDLALKELSALIVHRLRKTDVVARLGGDEFAILLPDTSLDQGRIAAENLRLEVEKASISLPVGRTRFNASFGLVSFPDNGADMEKLGISMDVAMYKAKRLGKNRVATLDATEEDTTMEVFTRGQRVQQALSDGHLVPFFQPIRLTGSGDPFGFEILARIRDGETHISAGEFIETAEELGLARQVDEAIFRATLSRLKESPVAGQPKLFFNLSARTISNEEWMRAIPGLVRSHGLSPNQIVLEITEREALPQFESLLRIMEDLRAEGLAFALDDFGSGFSSFLYLKYLAVDYVKIEGSFVRNLATDPRDRIMVEHIHGMASEFGLKTIAEFVEDQATCALLREIGIDYGQGYYYGYPKDEPV